jgi:pilus assembly protein Flp/PilA
MKHLHPLGYDRDLPPKDDIVWWRLMSFQFSSRVTSDPLKIKKDISMTYTRKALKIAIRTFAKDEDGATAIEYGLFAALVGAVIVGSVAALGQSTNTGFVTMNSALTTAQSGG